MEGQKSTPVRRKSIDWERFGLSSEPQSEKSQLLTGAGESSGLSNAGHNELFNEDQASKSKPWWKHNFFLSEPVLFGVWDGVFTSCMINLFSVIVFLRIGWIVGNAGIGQSVGVVFATVLIGTTTVLSGIGICERCHLESGGVHFILSRVLGARAGSAISLIYCFGQSVSCALHVMGFAESFAQVITITNTWIIRLIAVLVIVLLLGINVAGVKWVIRLQFGLLLVLLLASLDLAVGTFIKYDPEHGVIGYSLEILQNNTGPEYTNNENWFTVFGVFFPAMTGILAGINMSGDLRHPSTDIPVGTIASVGTSCFIYMVFVFGLGATCERWALHKDYMIAEKVAAIGVLFLAGLYISALSTCLGAIYATPRILQSIGNEKVIPFMKVLGKGAASDLDQLFPERVPHHKRNLPREGSSLTVTATDSPLSSPEEHSSLYSAESKESQGDKAVKKSTILNQDEEPVYGITDKPKNWYTFLCNRWIALLGCMVKVVMMFLVHWAYAVAAVLVVVITWFYIGKASPGYSSGIAEFRLFPWMKAAIYRCFGCKSVDYDQIVVAPVLPGVEVRAAQLTEDSADYSSRERFHQSKPIDNISPQYADSD